MIIKALIATTMFGLMMQLNASAGAVLRHRYSFSETNGTVVTDSVGGKTWNGVVKGTGAKWEKGQLVLPGGSSDSGNAYIELPDKIVSPLTNVTFEAWATWTDENEEPWQRIFDIGVSEEGKGKSGRGQSYLMLTAKRFGDDTVSFEETKNPDDDSNKIVLNGSISPTVNNEYYYAVVFDPVNNVSRLYVNGAEVAEDKAPRPLSQIDDINNWLGRSQWAENNLFKGSFNEFRIWEGALTADQIADHAKGGANQKIMTPAASRTDNQSKTKGQGGESKDGAGK